MPPNFLTPSQRSLLNGEASVQMLWYPWTCSKFFSLAWCAICSNLFQLNMFGEPSVLGTLNLIFQFADLNKLSQTLLQFVPLFERKKIRWSFNLNGRGIAMNISKAADYVHCEDSFVSPRIKTTLMTFYWETGIRWRRNIEMSPVHPVWTTSF